MVLPVLIRALGALGVALLGVLMWAGPALADVSVSPDRGSRGDAAALTLRVTEDRPGAHTTRIEVRIPEQTPVGEVFPMSVDGWGPTITSRKANQPVPGLHRPSVTDIVSSITWVRTEPPTGPNRVTDLRISLGPLPDADRLVLPVVQTYSDGTVVTWADPPGGAHPAPVITLTPGQPGGGHGAHGSAGGPMDHRAVAGQQVPEEDLPTDGLGLAGQIGVALGGGLVAGAAVGGGYLLLRRRRPDGTDDEAAEGSTAEDAATNDGDAAPAAAVDAGTDPDDPAGDDGSTGREPAGERPTGALTGGGSTWRLRE
ncbi:YcnI family protein [Plantactinospora sp. GCM10030261]|uniref:YcnI family protein n=1 Tax=Plantactinospora sp. GCM10030261 TaxID=3273420 RepID=UPI00362237DC